MNERIRPFKAEDAEFIIDNMREDDRKELEAHGFTPAKGILLSIENSTYLYTGVDKDGNPAFILGAWKQPDRKDAIIWLLGTDAIDREPLTFLRASRETVQDLFAITGAEILHNYVWSGNTTHIKWLRWLGFTILNESPDFIGFHLFYKHRE